LERVLAHYSVLGWSLAEETTVGGPGVAFHPDLVLKKGEKLLAVRISEDPLGTYHVGLFGAQCRRAKVKGLIVCEDSPEVLEACENAQLDFLPLETLGAPIVVPTTKPRPIAPIPEPVRPLAEFEEFSQPTTRTPWWRWAIVAVIWIAAIAASAYWLTLIL
jgi:hypothetical protein